MNIKSILYLFLTFASVSGMTKPSRPNKGSGSFFGRSNIQNMAHKQMNNAIDIMLNEAKALNEPPFIISSYYNFFQKMNSVQEVKNQTTNVTNYEFMKIEKFQVYMGWSASREEGKYDILMICDTPVDINATAGKPILRVVAMVFAPEFPRSKKYDYNFRLFKANLISFCKFFDYHLETKELMNWAMGRYYYILNEKKIIKTNEDEEED